MSRGRGREGRWVCVDMEEGQKQQMVPKHAVAMEEAQKQLKREDQNHGFVGKRRSKPEGGNLSVFWHGVGAEIDE